MPLLSSLGAAAARAYGLLAALGAIFSTKTMTPGVTSSAPGTSVYASWVASRKYLVPLSVAAPQTDFVYSTNGTTWSAGVGPVSVAQGFAANGSVIVGIFGQAFYTSTDGSTWTVRTGGHQGSGAPSLWDGSRFWSLSRYSASSFPTFYSSPTGTTWSQVNVFNASAGSGGYAMNLQHDGSGTYIATRSGSTAARRCTSDPTVVANWSAITLPSSGNWCGLAYGNSTWVACRAGSTAYATSTNGSTWTARTLPAAFSSGSTVFTDLTFAGGKFWFFNDAIYSSTDGITWSAETISGTPAGGNVRSWLYDGTKLRGFGTGQTYIEGTV